MTIITPLCQRIFVRFARKPIWMPTAPSKLFRIAEHNFYSPEESEQIRHLTDAYKAREATIQELMKHEFYLPATQSGGLPAEFVNKENKLDWQLEEENKLENARIAEQKEEFISKMIKDLEEKLNEEKSIREDKLIISAQEVNDYIKEQESNPNNFVTPENFDEMVEKAMENPVSYEFCINIQGKKIL